MTFGEGLLDGGSAVRRTAGFGSSCRQSALLAMANGHRRVRLSATAG
ncbi:hypothetical protein X743_16565 [Mesorhizobium sp. LNHC252B00]|nr:hypothetical protein X743_16565 [Mesorhizobium sp. LNHC252B00]